MPSDKMPRRRSPASPGNITVSAHRTVAIGRCRDCASIISLAYDEDNARTSLSHEYPHCPAWLKPGVAVIAKRDEATIDLALGGPL